MKEIQKYEIDGIDFGNLCRMIDNKALFKDSDDWYAYVTSVICALQEMREEIIVASERTSQNLGRGTRHLGFDHPTDVIWAMSIILVMRTIAILESKSRDTRRPAENRNDHRVILGKYLKILQELSEKKGEYASLFPYQE